jgi:hypothetical protein
MFTGGQEGYCTVLGMERPIRKTLQVARMITGTRPTEGGGGNCNKLCSREYSRPTFTLKGKGKGTPATGHQGP